MAASIAHLFSHLPCWTSDALLLQRYVHQRDEAAFTALVARHGNWVLRLCRRILGDVHAAEDAFQATFLILAQKAHSLKQPDALPAWLYGVARRVALKARTKSPRPRQPLDKALIDARPDPMTQVSARELLDILDEEVQRLPAAQRSAVVMCCLEGHPQDEAARMLGWSPGSLKGHLERGRRRLHDRLQRRGITLSAVLAVVAVSRCEAVSMLLAQNTVKAALNGSLGSSAGMLASSVLKAMLWGKAAGVMTVILAIAAAASTTVAFVYHEPAGQTPEDKKPAVSAALKEADERKPRVRTDALGDPLPDGAIRRLGTLRFRHGGNSGGSICNLLLTPDGKALVSNDYYGSRTVCVWEMATGKLLHQFPGNYDQQNIALSPDGKLVAIGQKKTIFLWDLASGKEFRRLAQADMHSFAFSPDGKTLAAAGYDAEIHLWDFVSGKEITKIRWPLQNEPSGLAVLAFTPDGRTLIAGGMFGSKIRLWDVASGKQRHEFDAKGGDIFSFALSPDGAILATGNRQGGIPLWDVKIGKMMQKLQAKGRKECTGVAFAPDGKTLAAIEREDNEDIVSFWDIASGKELPRPKNDIHAFWNVVFASDGKTLITGWCSAIRLWDLATGKETGPAAKAPAFVAFTALSPDDRTLAYYRNDGIRLWDMRANREIGAINAGPHGIQSLAFSPDGRTLAAGVGERRINLWDVGSHRLLRSLDWDIKTKGFWAGGLAFSPDGRLLASAYLGDSFVRIWDVASGKQVRWFDLSDPRAKKNNWVESNGVAFSPDGRLLAASGRTGFGSSRVAIWDMVTGKELPHLTEVMNDPAQKDEPSHSPGISMFETKMISPKVTCSPNGRMLVKNGRPKTISVWEVATGQQRLFLKGHEESTVCIAFTPDSRTLASASWDNTIRLWDLETGRELRKLTGHRGKANALAFSADGKTLVSTGDDTTILFWDVTDVTQRKRLPATSLSEREWQTLWEDLAGDDAAKAYTAMVRMASDGPTTLAALKKRLHPIRPVEPERLTQLFKDLDSDDFAVRETASRELQKRSDVIRPTLRQMLARPRLSLEQRRRLEALAASLEELSGPRLRQVRALEVLEMLGTMEARELLKTIAIGAPEARLTEQAKAALERLAHGQR